MDDEPLVLQVLQDVLRAQGCIPTGAMSAERALALLDEAPFDLVLSDIRMPGHSGLDLLRAVRTRQPHVPVVLITGYASVETAVEALRSGAADYLTKPFRLEDIEKVLARVPEWREKSILADNDAARRESGVGLPEGTQAIITAREAPPVLELVLGCCLNALEAQAGIISLEADGSPPLSLQTGEAALVERLAAWDAAVDRWATDEWSGLWLPIEGRRGRLGELSVARWAGRGRFLPEDEDLARAFTRHAALVVDNLVLHASVQSNLLNTMRGFVSALEAKDKRTRGHSMRVAVYAAEVVRALGLPADVATVTQHGALLHDLGKLVMYESILKKLSGPVPDEYTVMIQHPVIGEGILRPLRFLAEEARVVRHHHERYDGKGFPDGLAGEAITLPTRIVTVVNAFDAMVSGRPYRAAMPIEIALGEIDKGKGTEFDAKIVEVFVALPFHRLVEISQVNGGGDDLLP